MPLLLLLLYCSIDLFETLQYLQTFNKLFIFFRKQKQKQEKQKTKYFFFRIRD